MPYLTRYRPLPMMRSLQKEIDRLFGEFLPEVTDSEAGLAVWSPALDMKETESEYIISMEVPGIEKDQITINLEENRLSVSGERKLETEEEKDNLLVVERSYGRFFRNVLLPKAADDKEVEAELKDGVLTIRVQKAEEAKPRRIEIK